jgi:phage major head subunit gpT-like protein
MSGGFSSAAIERAVRGTLLDHMAAASSEMLDYAQFVKSEYRTEVHEWMGQPMRLVEFLGSSQITPLLGTSYSLENVPYSGTLSVDKGDWHANKSESYRIRFQQFAQVAAGFPNYLITQALINGTTNTGYDANAFFSTTHPARGDEGGTQSNLLTGTGTTASALHTDLGAAIGASLAFKGENGEPFFGGLTPSFDVVCHPNLMIPMSEALKAPLIANTSNVNIGIAGMYPNPWLSDVDDWYLLVKTPGKLPLIFQELQGIEVMTNNPQADTYRLNREIQITVDRDCAAGYGFWQSAIKTTN